MGLDGYDIVLWRSTKAQSGEARRVDLGELHQLLATPTVTDARDSVGLWSPTLTVAPPRRGAANVIALSCFVLDFDEGLAFEDLAADFEPYAYIFHTTFHHGVPKGDHPAVPRWRVIFPLARVVAAPHWPATWEKLSAAIGHGLADASCKNADRLYYLPCRRPGADFQSLLHPGEFLDPEKIKDVAAVPSAPPQVAKKKGGRPGDAYDAEAEQIFPALLAAHGFTLSHIKGEWSFWCRPGKHPKDGHSLQLGPWDTGYGVINYSTESPLEVHKLYRPFGFRAVLEFGGDFTKCASALAREGYGEPRAVTAVAANAEASEPPAGIMERTIEITNRELRDISSDALGALIAANDPPRIFVRDGMLTHIEVDERGERSIRALGPNGLRYYLARAADWVRITDKGPRHAAPPVDVVGDLLAHPDWPGIPILEGIASAPIVSSDGHIQRHSGYNERSRYHLAPSVDDWPRFDGSAKDAVAYLDTEIFEGFPFDSRASRAGAFALMLLPFIRPMIDGPTPLHFVDAPDPGTGKSLLVKACLMPSMGRPPASIPFPINEPDVEKLIFSMAMEGRSAIFFDNLTHKINSPSFTQAITSDRISGRILGQSATREIVFRSVMAATANNGRISEDMARRSVWIRLDAKVEDPHLRTGFRHENLLRFIDQNRGRVVGAVLRLVDHWLAAGRPGSPAQKGSFESWVNVVGGILGWSGVDGLLENDKELKTSRNEIGEMWNAFMADWEERYGGNPITAAELCENALNKGFLDAVFERANSERSRSMAFGRAIAAQVGKVRSGRRIERASMASGFARYRLVKTDGGSYAGFSSVSGLQEGGSRLEVHQKELL